ncbi:MAG: glycoside hydrolase family 3 C-terminal domain-containing protein, partial [Lachnospiraceae bacterium]|nr:glycoside hydrolase family 3 C-terminal domain-containing protein [Lachnospiraceae bacterium]
ILTLNKPVVIVINSGSSLDLSKYEDKANAIIQAWYSGEAGGKALANILFGNTCPSGKLPLTFYYNDQPLPDFTDYHMSGRTYKFIDHKPWFPFGYGLSYTKFSYSGCTIKANGNDISINVNVENTGKYDATEIVQVYIRYEDEAFEKPHHHLEAFQAVDIPSGKTKEVTLDIPLERFSSYLKDGSKALLNGKYTVFTGGCQPDERSLELTGVSPLANTLEIQDGHIV